MNTHQCIKPGCSTTYQDDEVDAYFCPACIALKAAVAEQLDGKFNTVGQQPSSALQEYDRARGNKAFPSAASLGIRI